MSLFKFSKKGNTMKENIKNPTKKNLFFRPSTIKTFLAKTLLVASLCTFNSVFAQQNKDYSPKNQIKTITGSTTGSNQTPDSIEINIDFPENQEKTYQFDDLVINIHNTRPFVPFFSRKFPPPVVLNPNMSKNEEVQKVFGDSKNLKNLLLTIPTENFDKIQGAINQILKTPSSFKGNYNGTFLTYTPNIIITPNFSFSLPAFFRSTVKANQTAELFIGYGLSFMPLREVNFVYFVSPDSSSLKLSFKSILVPIHELNAGFVLNNDQNYNLIKFWWRFLPYDGTGGGIQYTYYNQDWFCNFFLEANTFNHSFRINKEELFLNQFFNLNGEIGVMFNPSAGILKAMSVSLISANHSYEYTSESEDFSQTIGPNLYFMIGNTSIKFSLGVLYSRVVPFPGVLLCDISFRTVIPLGESILSFYPSLNMGFKNNENDETTGFYHLNLGISFAP
ncbi:MAG: hypothetical protein ACK4J0_03575 [Candidatus Anstonellaceae archaeon]